MAPQDELGQLSLYDVYLRGRLPESERRRHPEMLVTTTGAQTALLCHTCGPEPLDALLHRVRSVGLVLVGVHRLTRRAGSGATARTPAVDPPEEGALYEIRVEGELGEALLRYLGCRHYVIPEQTLVRLAAPAEELQSFLKVCTDGGASIERVGLVDRGARLDA